MARYNKIFAGPVSEPLPQVVELPADAAILPGTFIVESSGEFVYATTDIHARLFVAEENYLVGDGVDTAYAAGETVVGLHMLPEQFFNVRFPTGVNVARGAAITPGSSGKGKLAAAGDYVVAYAEEAYNNTSGSDQLVRVRACTGFYLPEPA